MENELPKKSISELFQALADRLFDWENPKEEILLDEDGAIAEPRIQDIMDSISRKVDGYESQEVLRTSKFYLERINKLKQEIRVTDYALLTQYSPEDEEYFSRREKRTKKAVDDAIKNEKIGLDYCTHLLNNIIGNHNNALNTNISVNKTEIKEIKLPDNFTVKQLAAHFEPLLSLRQATLFLYYLREKGFIPDYNASGLATLGHYFFARNNKNVREELSNISENRQNVKELKVLQQMLESILEEINTDLENAK